jgi:serine/threonine-protein kinase HipA
MAADGTDNDHGALSVSLRADAYMPWPSAPLASLADLDDMAQVVRRVLANEPVSEIQRRLIRPGVSLGGARPKSQIMLPGTR